MMHTQKLALVLAMSGLTFGALGCSGNDEPAPNGTSTTDKTTDKPVNSSTPDLPGGLFVAAAPQGALDVQELKADANGDEIVVKGRVGGRKDPFVDGVAMFVITDSRIENCAELHGDVCATPWDYCCEPAESLKKGVATVQVLDASGKPLRVALEGVQGLKPMAEVVVRGRIAQGGGSTLVINAEEIYVADMES